MSHKKIPSLKYENITTLFKMRDALEVLKDCNLVDNELVFAVRAELEEREDKYKEHNFFKEMKGLDIQRHVLVHIQDAIRHMGEFRDIPQALFEIYEIGQHLGLSTAEMNDDTGKEIRGEQQ